MRLYDTVTRRRFTTDDGVDMGRVGCDLVQMVTWLAEAEREVLASEEFHDLALKVLRGDRPTGSLNSWGRRRLSRYDFSFQKHNMNEILVSNVVGTLELYAMSVGLFQVMSTHPSTTKPDRILSYYRGTYPDAPQPPSGVVRAHLTRYHKKGERKASLPGVSAKLNLAVCDIYFAPKASRSESDPLSVTVQVKTPTYGLTRLHLRLPDNPGRFGDGKVCRPTIRLSSKGQIVFDLTIEHKTDERQTNKVVGIDLGKVEPFIATVIDPTNNQRSAPYHTQYKRRLGSLVKAEKKRRDLAAHLYKRAELCERHNRTDHADVLRIEAKRVSAKSTRIKHEINQCIANQIVSVANRTAKRYGLKTIKVRAKDTSRTCSRCGGKVSSNSKTRVASCTKCGFRLNRDVSASREIGLRAVSNSRNRNKMRSLLRQRTLKQSSAATRQPKPVTALSGIQGHTGTSNNSLEATLMMVKETLDPREPPT